MKIHQNNTDYLHLFLLLLLSDSPNNNQPKRIQTQSYNCYSVQKIHIELLNAILLLPAIANIYYVRPNDDKLHR